MLAVNMNKIKTFALIYVIFLCFSCSQEKQRSKFLMSNEEQKVIDDVFASLIYELKIIDSRKRFVPPPPPFSPDATNNEHTKKYKSKEEMDEAFWNAKEDYKIYIDTTDFAPLNIVVNDSVLGYNKKWLKSWYEEDNRLEFIDTTNIKKAFKIDLSNIKLSKDYILKYTSDLELPIDKLKNNERLKYPVQQKHLWQYTGTLFLHRLYFNKDRNYGVMQVGYNCGKLCGCGYVVFVKKVDNKWQIDKIESTGCA